MSWPSIAVSKHFELCENLNCKLETYGYDKSDRRSALSCLSNWICFRKKKFKAIWNCGKLSLTYFQTKMNGTSDGVCVARERCNSISLHFTSGLESQPDSPPDSPPLKNLDVEQPEKDIPKKSSSPKSNKRTRKMSLFSFHFNSKQEKSQGDEKHEKAETKPTRTRRISTPSRISPLPCDIPKFSFSSFHGSLTGSTTSSQTSSRESSPPPLRKNSERDYFNAVEKENNCIRDIIFETLKLQFEGVTSYNREICDRLGKNVSQMVKRRIEVMKESLGLQFKIVAVVYVAAVRDKGVEVVSQSLLETDRDNFTAASFRNGHIFVMGAVMAAQCR